MGTLAHLGKETKSEKLPHPVKWTYVMESCQLGSNLSHLNPLKL